LDLVTCSVPEARAIIEAGKARSLAVMASERNPAFKDVPTLKEAMGIDYTTGAWRGFAAPKGLPADIANSLTAALKKVNEAAEFLGRVDIVLEPKKRWPLDMSLSATSVIPAELRNGVGRALCYYGDAGFGRLVREGKYEHGRFDDQLVEASAQFIRERWQPEPFPKWVTAIPSRRHPRLVYDFASRLAALLGVPFVAAIVRTTDADEQKLMANSSMQARNVVGTLETIKEVPQGPVLLIDDIVDSGWTLTIAGWLLRKKGSSVVHPFTLARATARKT